MAIISKIKPIRGFSQIFHLFLQLLLPVLVFVLVNLNFIQLAFILILLSKWRMIAVKPRFWAANIQANALDIMVGISWAVFMDVSSNIFLKVGMVLGYIFWIVVIKPTSGQLATSVQSFVGQFLGLTALYVSWDSGPIWGLTLITALIAYISARHFFDSFNEVYSKMLSFFWAYFAASMAWILGHWLIYYKFISQPTLILTIISYSIGSIYYFDHFNKLNRYIRWQFLFLLFILVIIISFFSGWTNRIV